MLHLEGNFTDIINISLIVLQIRREKFKKAKAKYTKNIPEEVNFVANFPRS